MVVAGRRLVRAPHIRSEQGGERPHKPRAGGGVASPGRPRQSEGCPHNPRGCGRGASPTRPGQGERRPHPVRAGEGGPLATARGAEAMVRRPGAEATNRGPRRALRALPPRDAQREWRVGVGERTWSPHWPPRPARAARGRGVVCPGRAPEAQGCARPGRAGRAGVSDPATDRRSRAPRTRRQSGGGVRAIREVEP